MHSHSFGLLAEYLVMARYLFSGYLPIKHRWKSIAGEIDLIFKKGSLIVFCEVKARSSNFAKVENAVSLSQKKRLTKAAEHFLAINHRLKIKDTRFDLAFVRSYLNIKIFKGWIGW